MIPVILHYFVNGHVIFQWSCVKNKVSRFLSRRFSTIFMYWSLNFSTKLLSSAITLPLSISIISFCVLQLLLVRKGLKKLQNDLFVARLSLLTSSKHDLMHFFRSENLFLWVLKWIFPKFVSQTASFIYFFSKSSVDKRCMS